MQSEMGDPLFFYQPSSLACNGIQPNLFVRTSLILFYFVFFIELSVRCTLETLEGRGSELLKNFLSKGGFMFSSLLLKENLRFFKSISDYLLG